jgi:hypothetical protein
MRQLPNQCYEQQTGGEQVASEGQVFYLTEKVEVNDNGIFQWLKGAEYPQKGMPQAEAIFAVNVAKRLFIHSLRFASELWYILPIFITKRSLEGKIGAFNEISIKIISPYILIPQLLTSLARELGKFCTTFLLKIGISENTSIDFGKIIATMFEYDNAYRFRVQDLFTASSKEQIQSDPYKEICRLLDLAQQRDDAGVHKKFRYIKPILWIAFKVPRIRKSFIKTFDVIDFSKLQFDEIDNYWIGMRTDYDFYGLEPQERADRFLTGKKLPTPMTQQDYENYIRTISDSN